jgi:hypothetical protein
MKIKSALTAAALACAIASVGCVGKTTPLNAPATNSSVPVVSKTAGPLPENGFLAQVVLPDPPPKLRAGQKEPITVKVKNNSPVIWWARGGEVNDRNDNKFYIAIGDRWLDKDGKLLTEMDGRIGISKDLKPGEELEIPLLITAPKEPGDYILEVDMVQEQVAWFNEKGSPTFRTKVTVVK